MCCPLKAVALRLEYGEYDSQGAILTPGVHGLGRYVTAFRDEINNEEQFLAALHAGAFYPAVGLRTGNLQPYLA